MGWSNTAHALWAWPAEAGGWWGRTVFPADRIRRRHSNLGITVIAAIGMHPHDILARLVIVQYLGPLDDAVRAQVAASRTREKSTLITPLHKIL